MRLGPSPVQIRCCGRKTICANIVMRTTASKIDTLLAFPIKPAHGDLRHVLAAIFDFRPTDGKTCGAVMDNTLTAASDESRLLQNVLLAGG